MVDPRIRLRHLSCFLETIRMGSVARAGEALGLTQPAVSRGIAELEGIVGIALFDRSRRALALTPDGEAFAQFAQTALATLEQGLEVLDTTRSGAGAVTLGALPTVSAGLLPRALAEFRQTPLACTAVVESGPSPYLLGLLRSSAIAFVVGRLARPEAMAGLSFEQLYSEELAVVVRAGHPLCAKSDPSLRDIVAFATVIPPRQAIIRPAIEALLIAGGIAGLAKPIETVSNTLGRSLALSGDAVWIISESVVHGDIASGQLVRLPFDTRATLGAIGITTRTGAVLPPAAQALIGCVRAAASQ